MKVYKVYVQHYNEMKDSIYEHEKQYFSKLEDAEEEILRLKEKYKCNLKDKNERWQNVSHEWRECEFCGHIPNDKYIYETLYLEEVEVN